MASIFSAVAAQAFRRGTRARSKADEDTVVVEKTETMKRKAREGDAALGDPEDR